MARRKKESGLDILVSMPWWVGIFGALTVLLFTWVVLDYLHLPGWQTNVLIGMVDRAVHQRELRHLSWLFVLICLAGAAGSFVRKRARAQLLDRQRNIESLKALTWQQFERLVAEAYSRQGYKVAENGQGGADGGVDLFLFKGGSKWIVQCKRWRTASVGAPVIREMFGLMQHYGAVGVKIVCVGSFTRDAEAFAAGKPIELVGGESLFQLVESVRANQNAPQKLASSSGPQCPSCGGAMIRRRKRQTQEIFLGCAAYPRCRGVRALET
jgi:restriction system protein